MSYHWRNLRTGDRIRFLRMPPIFSRPDYYVPPETLALYELLISTNAPIEITDFLDDGTPIASYVDVRHTDSPISHGLFINDIDEDCWELDTERE